MTMPNRATIAAINNTGRNAIGIERDRGYFKIAQDRIASAQLPLLQAAE